MTPDEHKELMELMEEPPGGVNHGRVKNSNGRWTPLEPREYLPGMKDSYVPALDDITVSVKREQTPRRHGQSYTYQKIGCRCPVCKKWWADYVRARRKSV